MVCVVVYRKRAVYLDRGALHVFLAATAIYPCRAPRMLRPAFSSACRPSERAVLASCSSRVDRAGMLTSWTRYSSRLPDCRVQNGGLDDGGKNLDKVEFGFECVLFLLSLPDLMSHSRSWQGSWAENKSKVGKGLERRLVWDTTIVKTASAFWSIRTLRFSETWKELYFMHISWFHSCHGEIVLGGENISFQNPGHITQQVQLSTAFSFFEWEECHATVGQSNLASFLCCGPSLGWVVSRVGFKRTVFTFIFLAISLLFPSEMPYLSTVMILSAHTVTASAKTPWDSWSSMFMLLCWLRGLKYHGDILFFLLGVDQVCQCEIVWTGKFSV